MVKSDPVSVTETAAVQEPSLDEVLAFLRRNFALVEKQRLAEEQWIQDHPGREKPGWLQILVDGGRMLDAAIQRLASQAERERQAYQRGLSAGHRYGDSR